MLSDKQISQPRGGPLLRVLSNTDGPKHDDGDRMIVDGRVVSSKLPSRGVFDLRIPFWSSSVSSGILRTRNHPWHNDTVADKSSSIFQDSDDESSSTNSFYSLKTVVSSDIVKQKKHARSSSNRSYFSCSSSKQSVDSCSTAERMAYSQPRFVFKQPPKSLPPRRQAYPCSNGATTPKQSNTTKSFSDRLLFGVDEQGEDITRIPSTTFPPSDCEVDAPCATTTNKPSATADAQFEQVSWTSGEISMRSMLEEKHLSPACPPYGLVGRLQTEVRIVMSLSEIPPLPLSFEGSMERADVEGTQEVLSTFLESRVFDEDYYPTRHKKVSWCSDRVDFFPSKPKHVKSFETASTDSSDVSDESITRLYRDWSREQHQIVGALSLTDIFSWSSKGEIKTLPPTALPRDAPKNKKTKSTSSTSNSSRSKKLPKSKRKKKKCTIIDLDTGGAPSGPINLATGLPSWHIQIDTDLPTDCNQDDFEESYYSLQPPSMIESSCSSSSSSSSSSEGGESNPPLQESSQLHPVPSLNRSIKSKSSLSLRQLQVSSRDSRQCWGW